MRISAIKNVGTSKYTITGEGKNLFEAIMDLNKASFGDIDKCGNCGSDALYLEAHTAQGKYKYHSIKCRKCRASLTFGRREDDDSVSFLRRKEDGSYDWQTYDPKK